MIKSCFLTTLFLLTGITLAAQPVVTDSYLSTSWRENRVQIDLVGTANANRDVTLTARLHAWPDNDEPARTLPTSTVRADAEGNWSASLSSPLEGLKTWSRQSPDLYSYTVTVAENRGATTTTEPRRVGLREVWIEEGSFVLNGAPLTVVDDVWAMYGIPRDHDEAVLAMQQVKAMGFTGARLTHPAHLKAADESGIVSITNVGSFVRLNIWNPGSGLTRMDGEERREEVAQRIRDLREHPSIIAWSSAAPYSLAAMHPEYSGQYFNTWEHFPLNRFFGPPQQGQEIFRELTQIAAAIDPTRAVASHNGPFSPIQVSTLYLCDNLDLQEREEFWDVWFRSGPDRKVVWPSEVGVPFAGHQFIRYIAHQMPQGAVWPKIHLENLARLVGPDAYNQEEDANFSRWGRNSFYQLMDWPASQSLYAINIENILRTYRTYGVNFSTHHVFRENAYNIQGRKAQPNRKGLTAGFPNPEFDPPGPAALAYLKVSTPVLGYIGGPDTYFTNKDHLYFAGAPVRKAYVVVNDLDTPVTIDATWRLIDSAGLVAASGKLQGEVAAGRRALTKFPIEFPAPAVAERADFTLEVAPASNAKLPAQSKLDDTFALTVFPEHKTPEVKFSGKIWTLNISDDYTHESPQFFINRDNKALLEAAGIDATLVQGFASFDYIGYSPEAAIVLHRQVNRRNRDPIPQRVRSEAGYPTANDLLIIPRSTLPTGHGDREMVLRALEAMNFDQLVRDGMRVIIFEQPLENILGLQTESIRPRRTFIAAEGHPVFKGLRNSDLSYWTGSSQLDAGITPYSSTEIRWPERVWHTSNTNAVASRTLVRPQVGAARALAVSGFDLQESPLLEVAIGKGRIIFCQFDVSTRYRIDPAATRLVDNLFAYATTAPEPIPARGEVGTLTADASGVSLLKGFFRGALPEGQAAWGITQGDLFNREAIYNNNKITRTLPEREFPVLAGVKNEHGYPAVIRRGAARYETTLHPDLFETGWMKRKAAWVRAALLINQNGSSSHGPGFANHGRSTVLYPHVWVEGFVHPYTSNIW